MQIILFCCPNCSFNLCVQGVYSSILVGDPQKRGGHNTCILICKCVYFTMYNRTNLNIEEYPAVLLFDEVQGCWERECSPPNVDVPDFFCPWTLTNESRLKSAKSNLPSLFGHSVTPENSSTMWIPTISR